MKQGIVACPIHINNETTKECPDCREYKEKIRKVTTQSLSDWFNMIIRITAKYKFERLKLALKKKHNWKGEKINIPLYTKITK